nr:hypothetical protein [uncultured Pedobacter sp.]
MATKQQYREQLIDNFNQNFKNSSLQGEVSIVQQLLVINFISLQLRNRYISYQIDSHFDDGPHHEYFKKLKESFMNQFRNLSPSIINLFKMADVNAVRIDIMQMKFLEHSL